MTTTVDLARLAELWRMEELHVLIRGHGTLAADPWTLHRFRGALGHALAPGASAQALLGKPCPFRPPCGFALFHEAVDPDGLGLINDRPFTIEVDDLNGDLLICLRLFGQAADWGAEFMAAMVAACRAGLDADPGVRPPLPVDGAMRQTATLPAPLPPGLGLLVETVTPIVQKSDGQSRTTLVVPSLLTALARQRLSGLARWHGLLAGWDMTAIVAAANAIRDLAQDLTTPARFPTGRDKGRLRDAHSGHLRLPPPPPELVPLWRLASAVHLGADTAYGAGRVRLWLEDLAT